MIWSLLFFLFGFVLGKYYDFLRVPQRWQAFKAWWWALGKDVRLYEICPLERRKKRARERMVIVAGKIYYN